MANNAQYTVQGKGTYDSKDAQEGLNDQSKATNELASSQEELDGRIKILQGSVGILGGALEGVVGTLALSSAVSKENVEAFQNAAVGAIAFADGASRTLTGVKDLQEGLTTLAKNSTVAARASKILGSAIKVATGPIGLAVAGIGAFIAILIALRDKIEVVGKVVDFFGGLFNKVVEAVGLGATETEKFQEAQAALVPGLEREVKLLEAQGASTEDLIEKQRELLTAKRNALKEGTDEYKNAQNELDVFNAKVDADEKKRQADKNKEYRDQLKERNATFKSELQNLQDEAADLEAKTDEDRLALEYERQLRDIDNLKITEEQKNTLRLQAEANYQTKVGDLKEQKKKEQDEKDLALEQERLANIEKLSQDDLVKYSQQLDDIYNLQLSAQDRELNAIQDKYFELEQYYKDDADALVAIETQKQAEITAVNEAAEAARRQLVMGTIDNIQGALTALFGESKAVASANVLIDAAQAAVGIIKNSQGTGPLAIAYQASQFALLAATTIASLRQINQAEPGSTQTPNIPKGVNTTPRGIAGGSFIGGTSGVPAGGIAGGGEPPIRAYVVTGEVTNGQIAESQIRRRRSLGG